MYVRMSDDLLIEVLHFDQFGSYIGADLVV